MPIDASHIKLLAAERMSDASDGGGRMTATEIVSGAMNNIFPKVSRTDAVYGRVNLRKIYAAVQSATLDMYGGAHAMLVDAPDDAKIGCALFSTGSAFDTRAEARNRIESYVVAAGLSRMRIYGNQVQGAKAITVYQRVEEPLPEFGVLCLSVEAQGYTPATQFVRITDMEHEVRVYTDSSNVDYERRVIVLSLAAPLTQLFPGNEPTRGSDLSPTKIRSTMVADASKYYGIQPLTAAVPANALECSIASVYGALVPSTNREVPVGNAEIGGALVLQESGADLPGITLMLLNQAGTYRLPTGLKPGTFRTDANRFYDDGAGNVIFSVTSAVVGSIDYASGELVLTAALDTVRPPYYTPAAALGQPAHTRALDVTLATRGTIYVQTLNPLPARGTVTVSYRALGRWYSLQDDGAGTLTADSTAIGTGSVDYSTGAVVVTLGALPDVDSAVTFAWGSPIHAVVRAGATSDAGTAARQMIQLPADKLPVTAGSLTFTYLVNGISRPVTSNASGVLSGTGISGTIDQSSGLLSLDYTDKLPDVGSTLALAWQYAAPDDPQTPIQKTQSIASTGSGGDFALGEAVTPGSLRGTITLPFATGNAVYANLHDNGSGLIEQVVQAGVAAVGSINYGTGLITLNALWGYGQIYSVSGSTWAESVNGVALAPGLPGAFVYSSTAASTPTAATTTVTAAPLIDLTRTTTHPVIPGSVLFAATGRHYWDRDGTLYTRINTGDADETAAGSINYLTGECALSLYANNVALGLTVRACLTAWGEFTAIQADFRTAGSPLRPASFYLQATTLDGELISGTCDSNGVLTGAAMRGQVNQVMGVVQAEFGAMVTAAGNELEPWYDAANVVGGMIFKPREILPSTLRYNCVVLTNLPLDPTLLGLDPVRLPMDGRVPIYRPGDIVVLHHTDTTPLPNPVTPGTSYPLGRTALASVSLADSLGAPVLDAEWRVDLATGSLTIDSGALLAGLTQPLIATHRIEQMTLATDVQVSGRVSFAAPITRDYPAGSLLSSALMFGDLVARVSNVFDQATWTGVWSDTLIGSQGSAQYNDIAYPIEVLNDGALTERWRINFTSTTAFAVIGENTGQIATGTTAVDVAVNNPLTGQPYFVLRAAGWGSGWATGNQLRFNTVGANAPIWIARTILGGATLDGDAFTVELRGDTD